MDRPAHGSARREGGGGRGCSARAAESRRARGWKVGSCAPLDADNPPYAQYEHLLRLYMLPCSDMSHEGQRVVPDVPEIGEELAQDVGEAMQALASATRVRMLAKLQRAPMGVNELADALGMEPSAVSHQLRMLRHLNLVKGSRRANRVIYSLHDDHVGVLLPKPSITSPMSGSISSSGISRRFPRSSSPAAKAREPVHRLRDRARRVRSPLAGRDGLTSRHRDD